MTINAIPGSKYVVSLNSMDKVMAHPSGRGLLIANPDMPPRWGREEDGKWVETVIEPQPLGAAVQIDPLTLRQK